MQIEIVTKQDLEAFKKELLRDLTAFMDQTEKEKEWLRSKEVRQLLGISNNTLQNLRIKGLLKSSKIEGIHYYKLSEIKALLSAGTGK